MPPRRRFSIFYMGINIGALLSPLVCGYLGENINWHYGFRAAGVGMTLGLIQYVLGGKYWARRARRRRERRATSGTFSADLCGRRLWSCWRAGFAERTVSISANSCRMCSACSWPELLCVLYLAAERAGFSQQERRRFWAILVLFIASARSGRRSNRRDRR